MKIRLLQCDGLLLDINLKDTEWKIKALNTSVEAGIVEIIRPDTSYD